MDNTDIISLMSLAFGLGIVHALDADHIAAVSGLASTKANKQDSVHFCIKWALGHGASLLVIGGCVYLLGTAIPHQISHYAETLVGVVLIMIGIAIYRELIIKNAHLHIHRHDDLPPHAHWHTHEQTGIAHQQDAHRHRHAALMVGLLHGTAGSAPLLVLIPLAKMRSPWTGMLYLVMFSMAVLATMLIFGGVLGTIFQWLSKYGTTFIKTLKAIIATGSIGYGGYLLTGSFT